jgi:anti-sigma regulatory factor (Ser/Thr protein kinase)
MLSKKPFNWILHQLQQGKSITTAQVSDRFHLSRQGAQRYLKKLVHDGTAIRVGRARSSSYVLNDPKILTQYTHHHSFKQKLKRVGLQEDRVFQSIELEGHIDSLSEPAKDIFYYAFTEMLNNAIDHSQSTELCVTAQTGQDFAEFEVTDFGIGVYKSIRQKYQLEDIFAAIQELIKGKTTTAPEAHSGEGIFFTSKIADYFELDSEGKCLCFNDKINDYFIKDVRKRRGTRVRFQIDSQTKKNLADLFQAYTNSNMAFDTSSLKVHLFKVGTDLISRSQARRLLSNLEKFKKVTLDFEGVETVGQGFADEVFRVYHTKHPEVSIEPINMNDNVSFMVRRSTSLLQGK